MKGKYLTSIFVILLLSCTKTPETNDVILKYYGDAYEDIGYSVVKAGDGYAIAGQLTQITRENGNYITGSAKRFGVIRTSSDGNMIGEKIILGDSITAVATKVIALDDGSLVCTGYVNSTATQQDIIVVKIDASGNVSGQNIFHSSGNQYGIDIIKTQEGYLILGSTDIRREPVTDYTGNAAGKKDVLLIRINNNLEPIGLPVATGFLGNDEGVALKEDISGGYIIAGTTDRSDCPKAEQDGNNVFLLRVNSDISTTQFRILGGVKDEYAADIEVLADGYFVAGTLGNDGGVQSGYVWKLSENINDAPVSEHAIDIEPSMTSKSAFSLKAICRYKTNSFLMAGQYGSGSLARMLIFATDADGNFVEGKLKVEGGTGTQVAYDVISDGEDIISVGKNSYENNSMISLLKFRF
jgi:hypothetical protein